MDNRGQREAIAQLERIASVSDGGLRLLRVNEQALEGYWTALIDIDCSGIEVSDDGLPLRPREKFIIYIPEEFPFKHPCVRVPHARFSGFSHVQWVRYLCLYLSPEIEWNISDGMYGYIDRLSQWLIKGAVNEHEADGQPLHPPAVYSYDKKLPTVVTKADAPEFAGAFWSGFAELTEVHGGRLDLVGWREGLPKDGDALFAPAFLFSGDFPFEYPNNAGELFALLEKQGVSLEMLHAFLVFAAILNPKESALHFVIGSPMRGVKGEVPRQHLSVWSLDKTAVKVIGMEVQCLELIGVSREPEFLGRVRAIAQDCRKNALQCLQVERLRWCRVEEGRPEVTVRRDQGTTASSFAGKAVALWGCGALGSHIAEILVRAGVSRLILRDNKTVAPGILVRQNYEDRDVTVPKVDALRRRLESIDPSVTIEVDYDDISRQLPLLPELDGEGNAYDLVIDATASNALRIRLEEFMRHRPPSVEMTSVIIGQNADRAIFNYFPRNCQMSSFDALRKVRIEAGARQELGGYIQEFWPGQGEFLNFQPEPGCSDPTFIGSAIDMMLLVGRTMEQLGGLLGSGNGPISHLFAKTPLVDSEFTVAHDLDKLFVAPDGYQIRLSQNAHQEILRLAADHKMLAGDVCETGGLLFGQVDSAAGVIWISDVMGPPDDSKANPQRFDCGVEGTAEFNAELNERTGGMVSYVGMWHTHPVSEPLPSSTDMCGMATVMAEGGLVPDTQLLLIVGHSASDPQIGIHKFDMEVEGKGYGYMDMGVCEELQ